MPFQNPENSSRCPARFSAFLRNSSHSTGPYGINNRDGVRSSEPVKSVVDKSKNAHHLTFFVNFKFIDYAARG